MPKKICCCKEQQTPGNRKHYVAIPCYQYNSTIYSELGIQKLFDIIDVGQPLSLGEPNGPYKLHSTDSQGNQRIAPDYSREILLMMRGGGGGARPFSYGGNAAYIEHIFPTRSSSAFNSLNVFISAGGTGPEPGRFDIHTNIPFAGGGPGEPLAGWGGGSPLLTYEVPPIAGEEPSLIPGSGGGAAGITGSYGGHGGVTQGIDGSGAYGACGGSRTSGGTAGDLSAQDGLYKKGGRGYGNWGTSLIPSELYGGGGGAGFWGGGGGGVTGAGGGGSSSLKHFLIPGFYNLNGTYCFDGTDLGPGNRCNPFFSFDFDPGMGANRIGREINGIIFESPYHGANSEVVEYHRTKWCPCTESQVNFEQDTTGKIDYKTHICLTEEQYQIIIDNLPTVPAPVDLFGIRVSFELNGERYTLLQLDPETNDPSTDHYYCSLGCEDLFVESGIPTTVRWFIPSYNFDCFDDAFKWFSDNFQTYDFSNVTSCCDCFLAKPICSAPFTSCVGSIDPQGNLTGCVCPPIPPKPVAICKSSLENQNSAFYSFDPETQWLYLAVPGICWSQYGPDSLVKSFDCSDDPTKVLDYRYLPNNKGNATTVDPEAIIQLFCNEQTNQESCKDTGGVDCEITLQRIHPYCDYYAKKCAISVASNTKICVNSLYGLLACPPCPSNEIISNSVDTTVSLRCGDGFSITACDANCNDWPPSGEFCEDLDACLNSISSSPISTNFPNATSPINEIFAFFKSSSGKITKFVNNLPQFFTNIVFPYVYDNNTKIIVTKGSGIASNLLGGPGGGAGGGGGGGGVDPETQPCPCDGGVPTIGCLSSGDISFVGLKARINRLECPPSDYENALLCLDCGDVRERSRCILRGSWVDVVDETSSYISTTCMTMNLKEINEETANVLTITFPGCLFYDSETGEPLPEEEAKAKAKTLYSLTPEPDLGPIVTIGYNGTTEQKNVQKLTVCNLDILLVSCNSEDIANAINNCLGSNGGISASAGDPYSWMNYRLEPCPEIPPTAPVPETVQQIIKKGDILVDVDYQEYNAANNSVTVYFSAICTEGVETCVAIKTQPICGFEADDCGIGTINNSKSINIVSAANWSRGIRPYMNQYKQYQSYGDVLGGTNCESLYNVELCPEDGILDWDETNPMCTGEGIQRISCNVYGPRYNSCFVPGECNGNACPQVVNYCDILNCTTSTCGNPVPACVMELQCSLSATPPTIS